MRFRTDDTLGIGAPVLGHDVLQGVATALVPILSGWMTDNASKIRSASAFEWVKVNWVGANGKQIDTNTVQAAPAAPVRGLPGPNIGDPPVQAWHNTYALTLRTALGRGRSHAGRIYPPTPGVPLEGTTSYCQAGDATGMATAFARILYAIQNAFDSATGGLAGTTVAIVASPGDSVTGRTPLFQQITSVTCDRVPDVMHSRDRQVARNEVPRVLLGP